MLNYIAQVLGVIVALLEDPDESVQLTAVQCLLSVGYYIFRDLTFQSFLKSLCFHLYDKLGL